eukprot:5015191-Amphidinium_carterae.1
MLVLAACIHEAFEEMQAKLAEKEKAAQEAQEKASAALKDAHEREMEECRLLAVAVLLDTSGITQCHNLGIKTWKSTTSLSNAT